MTVSSGLPTVLVVENSLRENGGLRVSLEHARRLRASGARVRLAVVEDAHDTALAAPDPSLTVELLTTRGSRLRTSLVPALRRLVGRARQADVVVAGSEIGSCLLLGFLAARLARRPFVVLVQADLDHAIQDWVPRRLHRATRWVHRRVDAAVCVTESIVSGLVGNGLPGERAVVVVNGIDVAAVRTRAGLAPSGTDGLRDTAGGVGTGLPTVVANGRLTVAKDFPLLVRAHARVLRNGVDHRLVIMGEGPDREHIEAVVADEGVESSVSLPGFEPEPYKTIAAADLFVLSSRTEGLPLTVLEALAVGAPVIATRCGTGPDLLLDGGRYGELVPPGDLDALADAVERHLRDPGPLRQRATDGPARALEFDAGLSAARVLDLLTGLVRARSAPVTGAARG
jgi:glycosyltransferase involved in cell wall biosynthesis